MKFRLPRKIKKFFYGKIFLYPPDEHGSRLMAYPAENQKDYDAFKKGAVTPLFSRTKAEIKRRQEEFNSKYCQPIEVSDEELKTMVDEVFAEEYRKTALSMLLRAKNNQDKIKDYHIFINAYNLEDYNISAMCYDGLQNKKK